MNSGNFLSVSLFILIIVFGSCSREVIREAIVKKGLEPSFNSIPLAMEDYKPDGAYPEGYSYWIYGTTYNVMFLSATDKIWPSRFDYNEHTAFLKTGSFLKNMIAPSLESYNWGDSRIANMNVGMFWFAD